MLSTTTRIIRRTCAAIIRLTCRHQDIKVNASTGAEPSETDSANVVIGVTVCCRRCSKRWAADVTASSATLRRELVLEREMHKRELDHLGKMMRSPLGVV